MVLAGDFRQILPVILHLVITTRKVCWKLPVKTIVIPSLFRCFVKNLSEYIKCDFVGYSVFISNYELAIVYRFNQHGSIKLIKKFTKTS